MKAEQFVKTMGADFYTGVPDSQLKALCDYLMKTYGIDPAHHLIGANEGNCAAIAAGILAIICSIAIIWQPGRFRWCICRTAGRAISSIRPLPC